jgi:KaiC/GvpD/RAD55 family RecA-like ATPase
MSFRHFLIEGDPGSGKSTATYTTLYNMLDKFHPELVNEIWFVSNSQENASRTAKDAGMNHAVTMSKEEYFKRIAVNYE